MAVIEQLHADSAARINRRLLRGDVEVLVEREQEGRSTGRTRGGQLTHFDGVGLIGDLVDVTVDQVTPWSLQGRLGERALPGRRLARRCDTVERAPFDRLILLPAHPSTGSGRAGAGARLPAQGAPADP